jgi:hypothetical protein
LVPRKQSYDPWPRAEKLFVGAFAREHSIPLRRNRQLSRRCALEPILQKQLQIHYSLTSGNTIPESIVSRRVSAPSRLPKCQRGEILLVRLVSDSRKMAKKQLSPTIHFALWLVSWCERSTLLNPEVGYTGRTRRRVALILLPSIECECFDLRLPWYSLCLFPTLQFADFGFEVPPHSRLLRSLGESQGCRSWT